MLVFVGAPLLLSTPSCAIKTECREIFGQSTKRVTHSARRCTNQWDYCIRGSLENYSTRRLTLQRIRTANGGGGRGAVGLTASEIDTTDASIHDPQGHVRAEKHPYGQLHAHFPSIYGPMGDFAPPPAAPPMTKPPASSPSRLPRQGAASPRTAQSTRPPRAPPPSARQHLARPLLRPRPSCRPDA